MKALTIYIRSTWEQFHSELDRSQNSEFFLLFYQSLLIICFLIIPENDTQSYKATTTGAEGYQGASGGQHYQTYVDTDNEMMHNSMNTNIDILIGNCKRRNLANDRYK